MNKEVNQENIIDVQNLTIAYGKNENPTLAIEDINLQIKKGEFLCILGPSGCGKSTLLKAIAGFIQPTHGVCRMPGKPSSGPDWHRGGVFQCPALNRWLSIQEDVEFGPNLRGLPE